MRYLLLLFAACFLSLSRPALAGTTISAIQLDPIEIGKESDVRTFVSVELEDGYVLTPEAPSRISLSIAGEPLPAVKGRITGLESQWTLSVPSELDHFDVLVEGTLYFCQAEKSAVCKIHNVALRQPVRRVEAVGKNQVPVKIKP